MMRYSFAFFAALLLPSHAIHIGGGRTCGTHVPTTNETENVAKAMKDWSANNGKMIERKTVNIPTYWNTLTKNGQGDISNDVVTESIGILNAAFSPHFTFTLEGSVTKNIINNWPISPDNDSNIKSDLRKGGCDALNIYSGNIRQDLLGYATFPNECAGDKSYDGVVILHTTVPGGTEEFSNEGDTLTHEVGHWLGLYHTFEGGCNGKGDEVDDTPAVATPNEGCATGRDSCPNDGQGPDMVENFMDYSDDSCTTKFTAGQFTRMNTQWNVYRSDGTPPTPTPPAPTPIRRPTTAPITPSPITTPTSGEPTPSNSGEPTPTGSDNSDEPTPSSSETDPPATTPIRRPTTAPITPSPITTPTSGEPTPSNSGEPTPTGSDNSDEPTPSSSETDPPVITPAPTPSPTARPTNPPGPPTKDIECNNKQQILRVQIKTDNKAKQNRFVVKRRNNENEFKKKILDENDLEQNTINRFEACVNTVKYCYKLIVIDRASNGINGGHVRLFRDGKRIYDNSFSFGKTLARNFGNCRNN